MARYIDAEELQEEIKSLSVMLGGNNVFKTAKESVLRIIDDQPTADVVEVKHGHWEQNPYRERIYYCSECDRHIEDASKSPYKHFPYCHCGAKMDEKV